MAELTSQERLQPSLLDRLRDDAPDKKQELLNERVLSKAQLREAVRRDLQWLFNTTRLEAVVDMARLADVKTSVVNFGVRALSGHTATSIEEEELKRAIRQSIADFEPRILPSSLEVLALIRPDEIDYHNVVGVEIRGKLWSEPVPLEFLVRTQIDLETGHVDVEDVARQRMV